MSDAAPLRAVIDANLVISAVIAPLGLPARLMAARLRGAFRMVASEPLLDEIAAVLSRERFRRRFGVTDRNVKAIIEDLRITAEVITPLPLSELSVHCRDPKDDHVLACALAGDVTHIVSGDQDLLVLHRHPDLPGLAIVTVRAFLNEIAEL